MAITDAQKRAHDKYFKQNWKQIKLAMPKDEAQLLEDYCIKHDVPKAGFIREAIKEKMERDTNLSNTYATTPPMSNEP